MRYRSVITQGRSILFAFVISFLVICWFGGFTALGQIWAKTGASEVAHFVKYFYLYTYFHQYAPYILGFFLAIFMFIIAKKQDRWREFFACLFMLGATNLTTFIVKSYMISSLNPLLMTIFDRSFNIEIITFPSGHTTLFTSFVMALTIMVSEKARYHISLWGACVYAILGCVMFLAMVHRVADVVGGYMVVGFWTAVTFRLMARGNSKNLNQLKFPYLHFKFEKTFRRIVKIFAIVCIAISISILVFFNNQWSYSMPVTRFLVFLDSLAFIICCAFLTQLLIIRSAFFLPLSFRNKIEPSKKSTTLIVIKMLQ